MTVKNAKVLGPFTRYGLWVQGCKKKCNGCTAPDSWEINGGFERNVLDLTKEIMSIKNIEGITISGGEPFLQEETLVCLIEEIKLKRDLGVILYTGFDFSEIRDSKLTGLCDLIIDGEYNKRLDDGKSLRGSSNQSLNFISKRYEDYAGLYGEKGRENEVHFVDGSLVLVGIPEGKK